MDKSEIKRVIRFWFDRPPLDWIHAPQGLDAQVESEFGDLARQARRGELDGWAEEAEASLALVVLLDQFSRNLFRGMPDAFSADAKATQVATKAISRGFDKRVGVVEATAFYIPLMHQENLDSLVTTCSLFESLRHRCGTDEERKWVDMGIAASRRNMHQLDCFGRFPTRNSLLGRHSTKAEEEFLAKECDAA